MHSRADAVVSGCPLKIDGKTLPLTFERQNRRPVDSSSQEVVEIDGQSIVATNKSSILALEAREQSSLVEIRNGVESGDAADSIQRGASRKRIVHRLRAKSRPVRRS